MVLKFGLQSIKILALILTCLLFVSGVVLAIRGVMCVSVWDLNATQFVAVFKEGCSVAFYMGLIVIITSILGLISICASKYKLMIIYDVLVLILAIILLIYGLILWVGIKSEHSKLLIKLKATINGLSPEALDGIQTNFKCCGIEKFTDYIMLARLWNMSDASGASGARPKSKTFKNDTKFPAVPADNLPPMTISPELRTIQNLGTRKSWRQMPFR